METLKIELTGVNSLKALQELEHKRLIRIVKEPDSNSYALLGKELSAEDFKSWVKYAESTPTMSFGEAKEKWEIQKQELQKNVH